MFGRGYVGVQLPERGEAVCTIAGCCGDVEKGHLRLEGVNVDVKDSCIRTRFVLGGHPRDVAVENEDNIGCFEDFRGSCGGTDAGTMAERK